MNEPSLPLGTEQRSSLVQQNRIRYAQGYAKLGWRYIQQARQTQFTDSKLLQQASEAFFNAIQQKRQFAPPYMGLAYVLLLLGQPLKAKPYLEQAQKWAPNHPDIPLLLSFIQYQGASLQQGELQAFKPGLPADPELVYEQTEVAIYRLLKMISEKIPPLPRVLVEAAGIAQWETLCCELIEQGQALQLDLEWLDQTYDISELRQKFAPLERWCERAVAMLVFSRHVVTQRHRLQKLIQDVVYAICHPPIGTHMFQQQESQLEQTMDRCDELADTLDQLEEQGYNIEPFLTDYHTLVAHVERWQEVLDEGAEQLDKDNKLL